MDEAARVLIDALVSGQQMVVFADYDVDGASSAALLVRWLRHLGCETPIYVPDRVTEGYGPSPAAFARLKDEGAQLVVTVDCGAAAEDALAAAEAIGLGVVSDRPSSDARGRRQGPAVVVNPEHAPTVRPARGCFGGRGRDLRIARRPQPRGASARRCSPTGPNRDLKALAGSSRAGEAICDVYPTDPGFNRALAALGLSVMSSWANPGLAALMDAAGSPRTEGHCIPRWICPGSADQRRGPDRSFRSRSPIAGH